MVKFGIEFVPDRSPQKVVELATLAEEGGFEYVWITDHFNNRNTYVVLTATALSTQKVKLGPGVTNPYLTSPAWTASAVASLDEISGGRAVLGIGAGDRTTLETLGIGFLRLRPLSAIEESVDMIKLLWKGKAVHFKGAVFTLSGAKLNYTPGHAIPIYVGAQGPKLLELAGRIADGVLVNASHPIDLEPAIRQITQGATCANRNIQQVDIAAYTCFSIDQDAHRAKEKAREVVAFIIAGSPPDVLERHKAPSDLAQKISERLVAGDFPNAFSLVPDELVDVFSISGSIDDCIQRIRELISIGVTQIVVGSPIGPKKREAIELISREVMPRLV